MRKQVYSFMSVVMILGVLRAACTSTAAPRNDLG
jgi:hypothetical protein